MHTHTLILGGGPGGLSAAVALARAGVDVQVLERAPVVGGLTRTEVRDGFRFDLGGHRFYTKAQHVQEFVHGLLGRDLLLVPRLSTIHFRGRFVAYPLRPLDALRNVGLLTAAAVVRDLAALALRPRLAQPPRSLADWMLRNYGRTLFDTYFKVYAEKVWGLPAERIHPDLAAQRVKGVDLLATLRAMLAPAARATESMVQRFHYPRLGYGMICDAMAHALDGACLRLRSEPVRVVHDGRTVREVAVRLPDGDLAPVAVEHVISSIPLPSFVRAFDPPPPAAVQHACDALAFRAVVFVAVFLDRVRVRPESWIYFPSPAISFGRITEPRNWSAQMAPPGKTSVVAEHFCDVGDPTWRATDAELAERTIADLADVLGFFRREEVLGSAVVRASRAYPRMDVDHKRHVGVIEAFLDRFANVQSIGRGGLYRYHNTDHVIETGLAAAANVLGGAADVRAINTELTYHEERTTACNRACC